MMQNWKVKRTVIDGRRLYFDGTGSRFFRNWIKWFLLTIITLGIYSF
ncbi:PF05987 domain protein [Streptococcus oralis SK304]|uniref:PF05987 domain protein n=2 Tax=Streptococcus oralis TaxID=1303 RepID=J5GMZ9_STROR|nr:PF05987 domain protein [Streptococcus oralis SK304]